MVKKLLVPGLVIGFALLAALPEAQARHCRRTRVCSQTGVYGNNYQQGIVYNQPMVNNSAPQFSNASFSSACCNSQPAGVAQDFQGNGFQDGQNRQDGQYRQDGQNRQDGQYRSGYRPNGTAAPPPPADEPPAPRQ